MRHMLSIAFVALSLGAGLTRADDRSPDEVMNSHGLSKVGTTYLLDADRRRAKLERDLKAAESAAAARAQSYREAMQSLDQSNNTPQHLPC